MGVLYSVFPLDDQLRNYLDSEGISFPDSVPAGRHPKPGEIKAVLGALEGYEIEYSGGGLGEIWQAFVGHASEPDREWTLVNVLDYAGDDVPRSLHFEKGWPELIVRILVGLSRSCGTLVLVPDTGETPLIVTPETEPQSAVTLWGMTL
jgi:hypothetical protein